MAANPTHTRLAATAKRLIAANGRSINLQKEVRQDGPAYNPTISIENTAVTGVETRFSANEIDGVEVLRTDKAFLLNSDVDPADFIRLMDGSNKYSIVSRQVINPGEVTIIYKVQARA